GRPCPPAPCEGVRPLRRRRRRPRLSRAPAPWLRDAEAGPLGAPGLAAGDPGDRTHRRTPRPHVVAGRPTGDGLGGAARLDADAGRARRARAAARLAARGLGGPNRGGGAPLRQARKPQRALRGGTVERPREQVALAERAGEQAQRLPLLAALDPLRDDRQL